MPRWSWVVIFLWIIQDVFFQLPPPYNVSFWPLPLFAAELLLTWGMTLAIQVFRYVRVYDRLQRQQVKWLLFGLAIFLILNTLYRSAENLVPGWSRADSVYRLADGTVTALLFVTIPFAIGVAILRSRLFDIDLIINRTLVYGSLSASVIGMYVLVVVYLGTLLRTGYNAALSFVATGIIAILFQPLRNLLQRGVNRLMYGERDDPYAVLARLVADLARQAGVAVYAARLTTHLQHLTMSLQQAREHLVSKREEERRRLRRDLHDGLGPTLASLTFKVDAARNLLTQDSGRADRLLVAVRQQTQEAITEIRRLVYNLRPPALDELGLLSALRELAAQYQHQGLEVVFDTPASLPPLSAAVEVAVYRIAQEALANVVRHAQALHYLLRLSIDTETLHLDITDDGQGIPTSHHIGIGLHAMHERASELGGNCTITRASSGGTAIRVRLPLEAARDALPPSAQETEQQRQESTSAPDSHQVCQEE